MSLTVSRSTSEPEGWQALAQRHGNFYHDARWIRGIARCFDYRTHWITAAEGDQLVGGLALAEVPKLTGGRRLVSYPFSFIAGPMAAHDAAAKAVAEAARDIMRERNATRVEIKTLGPGGAVPDGFTRSTRYSTYRISPEGGEPAVWKRLDRTSVQQRIRKGEKAGVQVVMGTTEADWLAMAQLEERVQQGHGVPAPPRRLFTGLLRELQGRGLVDLYLARVPDGRIAAGFVMYKGPRDWIYAFSASDPVFVKEYRPTHVLLWAGLKGAVAANVILDLGRTAPEQASLAEFKSRWGSTVETLVYDYFPTAGGLTTARRDTGTLALAAKVWSRLPASVARLGSGLYRYLG
ncbi:MAG TPA: GNAT family N-acetyltransferase [Gemmatimonadales bacterium]|nr:GNAT family N-acetyltransferase [Gemmatimonadales bacterium]